MGFIDNHSPEDRYEALVCVAGPLYSETETAVPTMIIVAVPTMISMDLLNYDVLLSVRTCYTMIILAVPTT